MSKQIISTSRDEATCITRVMYSDGTFDAFTDAEIKQQTDAKEEVNKEAEGGVEKKEGVVKKLVKKLTKKKITKTNGKK